jgi:hypothetical protein
MASSSSVVRILFVYAEHTPAKSAPLEFMMSATIRPAFHSKHSSGDFNVKTTTAKPRTLTVQTQHFRENQDENLRRARQRRDYSKQRTAQWENEKEIPSPSPLSCHVYSPYQQTIVVVAPFHGHQRLRRYQWRNQQRDPQDRLIGQHRAG